MADEFILGIDIGTTSVKAGLIDQCGSLICSFSKKYPTKRQKYGYAEQNPDDWVNLIHKAISFFDNEGFSKRISCIGLCSQVNTHIFVSEDGKPLLPAILWQDGRASEQAAQLENSVSDKHKMDWWGSPMPIDASNVLSRMLWASQEKPEIWSKAKWVMLPKDYCIAQLTGEVTTDPISNIGLVDGKQNYISDVFDLVPGSREKIPPLAPLTKVVGTVKAGSPLAGLPVVSGTMDAWAGIIGTGGVNEGASVYLSGTSEIMGISSKTITPTSGVVLFPEVNNIRLHAAPTQSGGDAIVWFSNTTGLSLEQIANIAGDTPRSASTPLFLPQLEGERAPLWNTNLRGAFLGLSRQSGIGDMARAVYEGVAFSARHAFEALQSSSNTRSEKIFCAGGGFQSDSWKQIRADIFGVELHMLKAKEPGILGAGMIAALGIGAYADLQEASDNLVQYDYQYAPSKNAYEEYDKAFQIYKKAIDLNAELFK